MLITFEIWSSMNTGFAQRSAWHSETKYVLESEFRYLVVETAILRSFFAEINAQVVFSQLKKSAIWAQCAAVCALYSPHGAAFKNSVCARPVTNLIFK